MSVHSESVTETRTFDVYNACGSSELFAVLELTATGTVII